jgi:hypothetical protein
VTYFTEAACASYIITGIDDVLKREECVQAAWRNRIAVAARILMAAIAIICNRVRRSIKGSLHLILPPAAISFFLIADIDNPRGGAFISAPAKLREHLSQPLQ